jgi:hypothetical protein
VIVTVDQPVPPDPGDSSKTITGFSFNLATGEVKGDIKGTDISVTVPSGTDVTRLTPTITVSSGASINPASGVGQDFRCLVYYTVSVTHAPPPLGQASVTLVYPTDKASGELSGGDITISRPGGYHDFTVNGIFDT